VLFKFSCCAGDGPGPVLHMIGGMRRAMYGLMLDVNSNTSDKTVLRR